MKNRGCLRHLSTLDLAYVRRWLEKFSEVFEGTDPVAQFEQALRQAKSSGDV